jgi:hypothetical protein
MKFLHVIVLNCLGNNYFASDFKPESIRKYFDFLGENFRYDNYRVLVGDFRGPDWERAR